MKKLFETPEMIVLFTQNEDILTASADLSKLARLDDDQMLDWHRLG